MEKPPVVVEKPPPKHAYMLWLINMDRSAVNMAADFEQIVRELEVALAAQTPAIVVDRLGVMPLNRRTHDGARLIYGEDVPTQPIEIDLATGLSPSQLGIPVGGITQTIAIAAASAFLDEFDPSKPEQQNLADIGPTLSQEAVYDPNAETVTGKPLFDGTPDLFIVGTITHLARPCAESSASCALDGVAPRTFFTREQDGAASWLSLVTGLPASRVFHVSFTTSEEENPASFYDRCQKVAGFPQNYLDFLEPSPAPYYGPLTEGGEEAVPGRFFHHDLCTMLGSVRAPPLVLMARSMAQAVK